MSKPAIRTALTRAELWLDFARCYRLEATRNRPDYWLARADRAEQTAAA